MLGVVPSMTDGVYLIASSCFPCGCNVTMDGLQLKLRVFERTGRNIMGSSTGL